jgi:hypothetical protein
MSPRKLTKCLEKLWKRKQNEYEKGLNGGDITA